MLTATQLCEKLSLFHHLSLTSFIQIFMVLKMFNYTVKNLHVGIFIIN